MGNNTPNRNRNAENTADQILADGLSKHATTIPSIMIGGASVATKDIVTALQARIAAAKAATSAKATWQTAVKADRDERAKTKTLVSATKQTLLTSFAGQVDTLADFGLTPRKPRVMTPEARVAAAAKAKATRAARHTMGKNQKAGIVGTLDSNVITIPVPGAKPAPASPVAAAPTPVTPAPTLPAPTSPNAPVTPAAPTHGS
jgi:hypothetical protein